MICFKNEMRFATAIAAMAIVAETRMDFQDINITPYLSTKKRVANTATRSMPPSCYSFASSMSTYFSVASRAGMIVVVNEFGSTRPKQVASGVIHAKQNFFKCVHLSKF
jgi:hypothetical protein